MKEFFIKILLKLLKGLAPSLAIRLLTLIDPAEFADRVRPTIRELFVKAGPDWQRAFKEAWGKIETFMDELLNDPSIGL